MNGFSNDVISILRQNSILQKESVGLVLEYGKSDDATDLFNYLTRDREYLAVGRIPKSPVILFDYIVIHKDVLSVKNLLLALSNLSIGGIIVLEITGLDNAFESRFVSLFGNMTGTKVRYHNRSYMVIHSGVDYGD